MPETSQNEEEQPQRMQQPNGLTSHLLADSDVPADATISGRQEGDAIPTQTNLPSKMRRRSIVPPQTALAVVVDSANGRWSAVSRTVQSKMVNAFNNVQAFLQCTIVYIVSQEVQDLIAIFLLHVHPIPYCGQQDFTVCTPEWSSGWQGLYAVCMIIILSVLQLIASRYEQHYPTIAIFPAMARSCAGWALGNAFQRLVIELEFRIGCGTCHLVHLIFSVCLTLLCAVLTLIVQPLTLEKFFGKGIAEATLRTSWELVLKAFSWSQMMVWTDTLNKLVVSGATPVEIQGQLYPRLLALWALSLSSTFAVLTMQLARWRQYLTDQESEPVSSSDESDEVRDESESAPWRRWRAAQLRTSEMHDGGLSSRTTLIQALSLSEATLGWASGVAWINAVVNAPFMPSLAVMPTPLVCVQHGVVAAVLTVLALFWFVASSSTLSIDEQQKSNRDEVEKFFFTNGISFFVGFTWTLFIRALRVNLRVALHVAPGWQLWGEVLIVALFGPVLVAAVLKAKQASLEAYANSSGLSAQGKLRSLLARAAVADGSELNPEHLRHKRASTINPLLQRTVHWRASHMAPADG